MQLRVLEFNNGKTRLQFWNTPDGYAPHWKDVPVVRYEPCMVQGTRCPQCGSTLITDGVLQWCSFVGGETASWKVAACNYGISDRVAASVVNE